MKNLKKLNRKGFTLIELLAVIVILAVIMVIASTSVLSSMNNSRKKSLVNSAESAAAGFNTKYADLALSNESELFGMSLWGTSNDGLLNSGAPVKFKDGDTLNFDLEALNLNETDYDLENSFVYFNPDNSTFLVCFVAKQGGGFYVGAAASTSTSAIEVYQTSDDASITVPAKSMYACSNEKTSW